MSPWLLGHKICEKCLSDRPFNLKGGMVLFGFFFVFFSRTRNLFKFLFWSDKLFFLQILYG